MYRAMSLMAAMVLLALVGPGSGQSSTADKVKLDGSDFRGKHDGTLTNYWTRRNGVAHGFFNPAYVSECLVDLEEEQGISVSVEVVGQERKVALALQEPKGRFTSLTYFCLESSKEYTEKTAQLTYGEVPVKGTYKLLIFSDKPGRYILRAKATGKGAGEKEPGTTAKVPSTEKEIKARIAELEKEIEEREAEVDRLKRKLKKLGNE